MKRVIILIVAGLVAACIPFPQETPVVIPQAVPTTAPGSPLVTAPPADCTPALTAIRTEGIEAGDVVDPASPITIGWRLANTGSCPWDEGVQLVATSGVTSTEPALLPALQPGQTTDLTLNLTAPALSGSYSLVWQMQDAAGATIGEPLTVQFFVGQSGAPTPALTPTPTPTAQADCTNAMAFVSDVTIPDNSEVVPGEAFTKTWRVRNTGTCTWGGGYTLTFVRGETFGAATTNAFATTPPGDTVDISLVMVAPQAPGPYASRWQIRAPDGSAIGPEIYVTIRVTESTPTPDSPTLTPTP